MLKLTNLTTHPMDLDRFTEATEGIEDFLNSHGLDGFEVMLLDEWEDHRLPKGRIHGVHMRFWPMWLDFWKGNRQGLLKEFLTEEAVKSFYGGSDRETLIQHYKMELKRAHENQSNYVVFHASHVTLEQCYTYAFDQTDEMVIDSFIELINAITEGFSSETTLLFENQWWPGLTFLNPILMDQLMSCISYPKKGFMLDVGHLMNTHTGLRTESEGVDYILSCLETLGEERISWIKGIHLNSSLSGAYVEFSKEKSGDYDPEKPFMERYIEAYSHIGQIDGHNPFENPRISEIVDRVQPDYLVYEFITETYEALSEKIKRQHLAFENKK